MPAPLGQLSTAWMDALARIEKARQHPHYFPLLLLAVLDLLEEGRIELPVVWFEPLDQHFDLLLQRRSLPGRGMAWDPFFHLSQRARVWSLHLGSAPADFGDLPVGKDRASPRPKSHKQLVARADHAEFAPGLVGQLATVQGRGPLRAALLAMLGS